MRLITTWRKRVRARGGQAALEFMGAIIVWFLCASLFVNILLYFGSAMLMDSALDRVALRTSSYGCYNPAFLGSEGLSHSGLAVTNVTLIARATGSGATVDAPGVTDENYYPDYAMPGHTPEDVLLNSSGVLTNGAGVDATCNSSSGDLSSTNGVVPAGTYIVLQVTYTQKTWFLGSHTVHRTVTVVSNSLETPNAN